MKKIVISLGIIVVTAVITIGGTFALFSDTETSTGNIFTAGSIDLKVDHVKQIYNELDCKTCNLVLISDPTNMVVARNGGSLTPYPAVYVGSNGGFIHPAWTAEEHPLLVAANAKWIWESDPTKLADTITDTTYTFEKKFEWWGPIVAADFEMAVGHDNTVGVWLNGVNIGNGTHEQGYRQENMLHINGTTITNNILQGNNVLRFIVKNSEWPGGPLVNPAGLIYKFAIGGPCASDFFRSHCTLWSEKNLTPNDFFWRFEDVKPGDHGVNVISLHVYDNDALACGIVNNIVDNENGVIEPEQPDTAATGELSQFITLFAWDDPNKNGVHDSGETPLLGPNAPFSSAFNLQGLTATTTKYIAISWCAGTQDTNGVCSGTGDQNKAQTDSINAAMTFYAEQARNNEALDCDAKKTELDQRLIP
ncbi:MAG: TasA family protein [Patescibacteria group bacterium]